MVLPNSHSLGCLLYYCTSLIKSCLKNPSSPYSESSSCTDSSDETSAVIRSTTVYLLIFTDSIVAHCNHSHAVHSPSSDLLHAHWEEILPEILAPCSNHNETAVWPYHNFQIYKIEPFLLRSLLFSSELAFSALLYPIDTLLLSDKSSFDHRARALFLFRRSILDFSVDLRHRLPISTSQRFAFTFQVL